MTASVSLHTWFTAAAYLGAGVVAILALRAVLTKLHRKAEHTKWRAVVTSFLRTVTPWCVGVAFLWGAVLALPFDAAYHHDLDRVLVAVIIVVVSIGSAKVAGEVVRTPDATTGTGGHIPLDPYGPVCSDGHRGCAQAMLSSGSITAQVSAALGHAVDYDETLRLAASDHPAARAVVDAAGTALGRFITLAANLSLQSAVVLSGEGIGLFRVAEPAVREAIAAGRDARATPIDIHVDESGFRAWARGAAAVAIQHSMAGIQ